jgi:hypothetical protein
MEFSTYFLIYVGIGLLANLLITMTCGVDFWKTQKKEFSDPEFSDGMFAAFSLLWPIMLVFGLPSMLGDLRDSRQKKRLESEYVHLMDKEADDLLGIVTKNYKSIFEKFSSEQEITGKDIEDLILICDFYDALNEIEMVSAGELAGILKSAILKIHSTFSPSTAKKYEKKLLKELENFKK